MDTTCAPCQDFYRYANGAWLDTATFAAEFNTLGVRRDMEERVTAAVHDILEAAARAPAGADPDTRMVGVFYGGCMDSARADRLGATAIGDELRRLSRLRSRSELPDALLRLHKAGIFAPFWLGPEPDPELANRYIGVLYQAGIGLPERDYYLRSDPTSDSLRQGYVAHIHRTFRLLGWPDSLAARSARRVMAFETRLARASMTLVAQRDPDSIHHKKSVGDLAAIVPALDWTAYFHGLGVSTLTSPDDSLDVAQPDFLAEVNRLLTEAPMSDWRSYLQWHLTIALASDMGSAFFREQFAFDQQFSGVLTPLPRWRRCAEEADAVLGDLLGRVYVTRQLTPDTRARVSAMTDAIRSAFGDRINQLPWMSDSTKGEARRKLEGVHQHVAYPEQWQDITGLTITPNNSHAANLLSAMTYVTRRELGKIGRSVDRDEWRLTPMLVDAFYNPSVNGIFVLPGMLQAPRYVPQGDDAVNYGSLGTLIGHEFTHGFDDEGRRYDAEGNLRDWWTGEDAQRFAELARRVVEQYSAYVAVDTLHVNGELTLGENIADLGGVVIAYDAFQLARAGQPDPGLIDGFTPEQRFFLGYAQGWRRLYRPETMRFRTLTDPHSPPSWRINGSLANVVAFAQAFGCKAGDPMVRVADLRTTIW